MKGVIFTEFLEMVEEKYGLEMVDEIIENANLESKGSYTSICTYDFSEMLQLVKNLSHKTGISSDDLFLVYSEYFFKLLQKNYPDFFEAYKCPFDMLASIESHIHVEVLKIYPDAELPTFEVIERKEETLVMIYKSSRAMYSFSLGLIHKTFECFDSKVRVILEKIKEDGTEVMFTITKN